MGEFGLQSLYGNISGYIGFFLGYSLFQIPNFFLAVYYFVKRLLFKEKNIQSITEDPTKFDVGKYRKPTAKVEESNIHGKYLVRNVDEEFKRLDMELYEISRKFQELHNFIKT